MNKLLAAATFIIITLFASCREDDVRPEIEKCKIINQHLPVYKQKTLDFTGQAQQNGYVTGYLDGKELKLANASSFSPTGRKENAYYFHSNHLVAVKQEEYTYNKPTYITEELAVKNGDSSWYDDTKTVMKINWCYFYNGHMVRWIGPGHNIIPDNDRQWDNKEDGLLQDAEKLKKMLRD